MCQCYQFAFTACPALHSPSHTTVPAKVSLQEWPYHLPQSSGRCSLWLWCWGGWRNPRRTPASLLLLFHWHFSRADCQRRAQLPSPESHWMDLKCLLQGWNNRSLICLHHSSNPAGFCCMWILQLTRSLMILVVRWTWWENWRTRLHDHSWRALQGNKGETKRKMLMFCSFYYVVATKFLQNFSQMLRLLNKKQKAYLFIIRLCYTMFKEHVIDEYCLLGSHLMFFVLLSSVQSFSAES